MWRRTLLRAQSRRFFELFLRVIRCCRLLRLAVCTCAHLGPICSLSRYLAMMDYRGDYLKMPFVLCPTRERRLIPLRINCSFEPSCVLPILSICLSSLLDFTLHISWPPFASCEHRARTNAEHDLLVSACLCYITVLMCALCAPNWSH